MKIRVFACAALALCAIATAGAADIKPGLWEFRSRMDSPGMPDLSAQMATMREQMKNMPPEARRAIEQQMAAQGVAFGEGGALEACITPESVKRGDVFSGRQEGDCTYSNVSSTATRVRGTILCSRPKASGEFEALIESPTRFTSKVSMRSAEGALKVDTDARWIAADCGRITPPTR